MPLEFYPPVMNFLSYLTDYSANNISVFSTNNFKQRVEYQNGKLVRINRSNHPNNKDSAIKKTLKYLHFNVLFALRLFWIKPDKIIYYETISALPVYLYLKIKRNKPELIILQHEYFSTEWYQSTATKFVRLVHKLEINYLYPLAKFISQTNADRKQHFLTDYPFLVDRKIILMPNYPPKKWMNISKEVANKTHPPYKFVYVGSLSMNYSYIEKFCEWIIKNATICTLDVYSFNIEQKTADYLNSIKSDSIRLHQEGIEYNDLPNLLRNYDVGVVLYNSITDNYKYNAPNKIFEYLASGIDVWFSKDLITSKNYITADSYPKVLEVDFERMDQLDLHSMIDRKNLERSNNKYTCEAIYSNVLNELQSS